MYWRRNGYIKMFKRELKNETIALGAIYQASNEIKKIAWEGIITKNIVQPLIYSIYQTTSEDIEDIYINTKRLNPGLDFLRKQLVGDAFSKDAEVTRYFEAIGILVKNMKKNEKVILSLRDELSNSSKEVREDNLDDHAETLSKLYLRTVSKVEPRIIVNGDNKHLTVSKNASMIRALLMSAIRSYILWQQSGGSKLRIFLFRKKIAELALRV
jgi:high frequency lysogenization protein